MTQLAIALVLTSAVFHATWNLLSKRAGGGLPFVWLFSALMTLIYALPALASFIITQYTLTPDHLFAMLVTSALHLVYFLLLTKGYQIGDLSVIYPLARGTGPMLATLGAIVIFHERPTPLAIIGLLCIGIGVFLFTGGMSIFKQSGLQKSILYALLIGLIIASYTMWDKHSVGVLFIPPLIYEWVTDFFRTVVLGTQLRGQWSEVKREWQEHRLEAIGVAILSPLAYLLVLIALTFSPVSYIAPFREVSILFGAIMGTYLLGEGNVRRRWSASAVIVVGVLALAFG